VVGGAVCGR